MTVRTEKNPREFMGRLVAAGWSPETPSEECVRLTTLPEWARSWPGVTAMDRVGVHMHLIVSLMKKRLRLNRTTMEEDILLAGCGLTYAARAAGGLEELEPGKWDISPGALMPWLEKIKAWEETRYGPAKAEHVAWLETGEDDPRPSRSWRAAIMDMEARLMQEAGLVDRDRDLRTMKTAWRQHDPGAEGAFRRKDLARVFQMLQRDESGRARRLMIPTKRGLKLGEDEAIRAMGQVFGPIVSGPRERERISLERGDETIRERVDEQATELFEMLEVMGSARRAWELLEELRGKARQGSARSQVLVRDRFMLLLERGGVTLVARELGLDESTVRAERDWALAELRRRLGA